MNLADWRRFAAPAAALALLALMIAASPDFGFTWDERFQQRYGEQIWDYYHGRVPRSDFDTDFGNEYLYGGLVELLCVVAQQVVRADAYLVRHAVISIFGWIGIVFSGLLAARLFGARAGWLAAILLALSPRYFGDSMNNPKDLPFAALAMVALYYTLTISPRPPHLTWRHAAKLAAAIALAINIRPLGLMLLGFAALVIGTLAVAAALRTSDRLRWRGLGAVAVRLAVVGLVAIPAGTLAWPWAQGSPFARPIEGFLIATGLHWASDFHVLYAGQDLGAGGLPWHYVPTWLAISLPPVILVGLALSVAFFRRVAAQPALTALAAFALTPIAVAILRHATIYDGIRHLEFIVPPLVVLSAGGWNAALETGGNGRARAAVVVALLVGMAEPLAFQIRNHPNQIVYFSPVMGGPRAAFARFDMDYWGNCVLQAVEWSARVAEHSQMPAVVSGNPPQAIEADAARYRSLAFAHRESKDYHLDIRLLRGPRDSVREFASRGDVLYTVTTADGAPLCVVLPGPAYPQLKERLDKLGPSLPAR